jgi:tetratricopeptide (TPR) repeat protein
MAQDDRVHAEEQEDEEEQEKEDDPGDKARKEEYLQFKRNMNDIKGAQEGMVSDSESYKKQGNAYFQFKCYSQATLMYSDAIDLQPHNEVLFCNRAMAYLKQDMPELALKDAEMSLSINATVDNIKAYWRKAQALLDMKRYTEADEAASAGLELHGRNPHLNKVRKQAREVLIVDKLVAGDWVGTDKGIEQRRSFTRDGDMTISVFGHAIESTYDLSIEGHPRSMLVKMKQAKGPGSPPPTPPMVYIFEFHDDDKELWLCHPVGTTELPTKFEGPGFCKNRRVDKALADDVDTSNDLLDVRCARYMREMNAAIPEMVRQLPEKPTDDQIREEVEICSKISRLKKYYGPEVHERAVELANMPEIAEGEDMKELAQQLRSRFVARKFITEEKPAIKLGGASDGKSSAPSQRLASKSAGQSCFSGLVMRLCGGSAKSS